MRIAAVIAIVGAHDARYAASRLAMPVSDGSCRARILARRQRRHAKGRRHDRTIRTLSVSGPCHYLAAPVR
jgi:hypothetical protein